MSADKDFKFNKRASSYDTGFEGRLSSKFYRLLLSQVKLKHGETVLDVGCGTGTILKSLSNIGKVDGYGIDIEENMIREAKSKCPQMNIQISDSTDTPFSDNKFDIITSCMAYHHFSDKNGFAKEASRIIKPGGYLYIADPRFPFIVRKPLNLALRLHKIAGYFGAPEEIKNNFSAYGFEMVDYKFDMYAQCIKLRKAS